MRPPKFKAGDRVKLIGYSESGYCVDGLKSDVTGIDGKLVCVRTPDDRCFVVTESQCRRLRKRERRRVWLKFDAKPIEVSFTCPESAGWAQPLDKWREFREVAKRKGAK